MTTTETVSGQGQRIGLFGGSFDPPHRGHLLPVSSACSTLGLDVVYYLPTARPPHKPGRELAPAWRRFAMVELMLLEERRLLASPFELRPGEVSYTVETVEHFRNRFPQAEIWLLMGSDSFAQFHTWVRWREIAEQARLGVLSRPGWDEARVRSSADPEVLALLERGDARLLKERLEDLSSTEMRQALAAETAIPAGALPGPVLDYIRKYQLYR